MPTRLVTFPPKENSALQVYCPDGKTIVTSFENYLPPSDGVGTITDPQPHLPAKLRWHREHFDYFAYLPKEGLFDGHLLAPLKHHKPKPIQKNGRWFVDDQTRELWRSLDNNITHSINVVGRGMLVDLADHEPRQAAKFGFAYGHRTEQHLQVSLKVSRDAIIYRLAYLTYLVSRRYQWHQDLVDQDWWKDFRARCSPTWVDSLWDTVCRQCRARNFIGVVIRPVSASVRWTGSALNFGVPIWVWIPGPGYYNHLDGGFHTKAWEPTKEQVVKARLAAEAGLIAKPTTPPPPKIARQTSWNQIPQSTPIPHPLPLGSQRTPAGTRAGKNFSKNAKTAIRSTFRPHPKLISSPGNLGHRAGKVLLARTERGFMSGSPVVLGVSFEFSRPGSKLLRIGSHTTQQG